MSPVPNSLKQLFLKHRAQDIEICFQKWTHSDWNYFETLGHQLKGNAPSFGFEELAPIARRIESFSQQRESEKLKSALVEFQKWFDQQR